MFTDVIMLSKTWDILCWHYWSIFIFITQ